MAPWLAALPWLALALLVAAVSIHKIYSVDYWWMLRIGQWIAENGQVPRVDRFSFVAQGSPYLDIHWLFQLGLYHAWRILGHGAAALVTFGGALASVALLAPIGSRRSRPAVSVALLALFLLGSGYRFLPRPEMLSFVFLAAELALFDRFRRKRDLWIFGVVAIQGVWVNVHGLFALGLAVSAIYAFEEGVAALRSGSVENRWGRAVDAAGVVVLSLIVSFLNPNGIAAVLYPVQQLFMLGTPASPSHFSLVVNELLPPFHDKSPLTALALSLPLALAFVSASAMAINWRRIRLSDALLWLAFAYLALTAQRNVPLFAIVATPLAVRHLNEILDRRPQGKLERGQRVAAAVVTAMILVAVVDIGRDRFYTRMGTPVEVGFGVMESRLPVGAFEWIARERPPGPIYHRLGYGGYLLWTLFPDYQSYLDGRLEVFGLKRIVSMVALTPESFRGLDDFFHFGVAVLGHEGRMPLYGALHGDPSWRLAYVDDFASVFVRSDALAGEPPPAVDPTEPNVLPPLVPSRGRVQDLDFWRKRLNLFIALEEYDRALVLLDGVVALRPDFPDADAYRDAIAGRRRAQRFGREPVPDRVESLAQPGGIEP